MLVKPANTWSFSELFKEAAWGSNDKMGQAGALQIIRGKGKEIFITGDQIGCLNRLGEGEIGVVLGVTTEFEARRSFDNSHLP